MGPQICRHRSTQNKVFKCSGEFIISTEMLRKKKRKWNTHWKQPKILTQRFKPLAYIISGLYNGVTNFQKKCIIKKYIIF